MRIVSGGRDFAGRLQSSQTPVARLNPDPRFEFLKA